MPVRAPRVTLVLSILVPSHQEGVTDVAPWLRPLRVTGLLLVLLAGPAPMSYAVPCVSSYEPAPGESRAGAGPERDASGLAGPRRRRRQRKRKRTRKRSTRHRTGLGKKRRRRMPGSVTRTVQRTANSRRALSPPRRPGTPRRGLTRLPTPSRPPAACTRLGTRPAGPAPRQRTGPHRSGPRPHVRRTARTAGLRRGRPRPASAVESYGSVSSTLPMLPLSSSTRCASAASLIGSSRSTTGRT